MRVNKYTERIRTLTDKGKYVKEMLNCDDHMISIQAHLNVKIFTSLKVPEETERDSRVETSHDVFGF